MAKFVSDENLTEFKRKCDETYATKTGTFEGMRVGNATRADTAGYADGATNDSDGNNVANTYVKKSDLLDLVYPIGTIVYNYDLGGNSPASTLGGTWTRIYNKFLIGGGSNYTIGTEGGEEFHQLTVAEMPSHTHAIQRNDTWETAGFTIIDTKSGSKWGVGPNKSYKGDAGVGPYGNLNNTGNDAPHNNMPPYRAVWMWRRTA